jgi:hypothetical protein
MGAQSPILTSRGDTAALSVVTRALTDTGPASSTIAGSVVNRIQNGSCRIENGMAEYTIPEMEIKAVMMDGRTRLLPSASWSSGGKMTVAQLWLRLPFERTLWIKVRTQP